MAFLDKETRMPMKESSTLMYFVHLIEKDLGIQESQNAEQHRVSFFREDKNRQDTFLDKRVSNIMNFARSYEVAKTKTTGYVEMILN